MAQFFCVTCNLQGQGRGMTRLLPNEDLKIEIVQNRREENGLDQVDIGQQSRLCFNCNLSITREIMMMENNPNLVKLKCLKQNNRRTCMICNAADNVHRVSQDFRADIFIEENIFIANETRCCQHHLCDQSLLLDFLKPTLRSVERPIILQGEDLQIFLQGMRKMALKARERKSFLTLQSLNDQEFKSLVGLSKIDFNDLFNYCDPVLDSNGKQR